MNNIDMDILKYMSKRDNYNELKDVITKSLCVKESWQLLTDFGEYFKEHPQVSEIDKDFIMWQRVKRHPNWKPDVARVYNDIVENILSNNTPERGVFLDMIHHIKATELYKSIANDMSKGQLTVEQADAKTRSLLKQAPVDSTLVNLSLNDLASQSRGGGYYWRLEDLNRSLGPIKKGDFIVIAKRPEVGGTSFLVSEMSFMLEQMEGNAVLFNNEEAPDKVFSRMVSSALNVDYRKLLSDPPKYDADYKTWLNGRTWDLVHDTSMTIASIHKQLEEKTYDLIGINVLLKVGGTGKQEDHDKFQELGEECRRIAQKYGPVVAIVQADPSAEGMQFIPQDRIYKSKTALQGEADALIMIGTDEDIKDDVRYIHVAKNKIPPASCSDIRCKHIKAEVKFSMDTGRFTSANFEKHSRPKRK